MGVAIGQWFYARHLEKKLDAINEKVLLNERRAKEFEVDEKVREL